MTDNLPSYLLLARRLGLRQQACSFHLLPWTGKGLLRLGRGLGEEWAAILAQVRETIRDRAMDGGIVPSGCRRGSPGVGLGPHSFLCRLKALVLRLAEGWEGYCLHRREPTVPTTLVPPSRTQGCFRANAVGASRPGPARKQPSSSLI